MSQFGPYEPPTKGMKRVEGGPEALYVPDTNWQFFIKEGAKEVACEELQYVTSHKVLATLVSYGIAFQGRCPDGLDEIQDWHDQN